MQAAKKKKPGFHTVDIHGKEWCDRATGNSYQAVRVILDYGTPKERTLVHPMIYGYSDHYLQLAAKLISRETGEPFEELFPLSLWARENKVIVRGNLQTKCRKQDVKDFGEL
jgi:hypothetical protein